MQPLEPFRKELVTVSGMKAPWGESVHVGASAAFLNGVGPMRLARLDGDAFGKIQSKKTVDQFIADHIAGDAPLRSLEVGTEDMGTRGGAATASRAPSSTRSAWRDDVSPLPVGINPRVTFERMFGETGSASQRAKALKQKQSLLDSVTEEASRHAETLGAKDPRDPRRVSEQHPPGRAAARSHGDRLGTITEIRKRPVGLPEAFDDHVTVTYNLMHLAYQGDISRVFTFLLGHEASTQATRTSAVPEAHHSISHHGNDAEKLAKYAKIGTYHIVKFAEFLDKLKATRDGDGTLLDHSLLYWGSGMSNGNQHDRNNPPRWASVHRSGAHNGRVQARSTHQGEEGVSRPRNLLLAIVRTSPAGRSCQAMGASNGRLRSQTLGHAALARLTLENWARTIYAHTSVLEPPRSPCFYLLPPRRGGADSAPASGAAERIWTEIQKCA
jgi:hypothetical protein